MKPNLRRLFGRWIRSDTYRCLQLTWERYASAAKSALPPGLEIRPLEPAELEAQAKDPASEISADFVARLRPANDVCIAALSEGKLVSYAFFSNEGTAIDRQLRFRFPPGWIYVYKAYTLPEWRGRRVLQYVLDHAQRTLEERFAPDRRPAGLVTLVMTHNAPSLRGFSRCGFAAVGDAAVPVVLGRPRMRGPLELVPGFTIDASDHERV